MLCKNCGKELPIAGRFCPFCGATIEQTGVTDETTVFSGLPEELAGPIDTSAFDAAMRESHPSANPSADSLGGSAPRPSAPPRAAASAPRPSAASGGTPHTTRFENNRMTDELPYRKPSKGKKAAVVTAVVLLVIALIAGGIWFILSRRPDENLTLAERFMERGDFDRALEYYLAAQTESGDSAALEATIQLLRDLQDAQAYLENDQFTEALAALKQLQNRVTDPDSTLYESIEELIEQAEEGQAEVRFAADLAEAQGYLNDKKYDAAAGKLDSLAADSSLTSEQRRQVEELRKQLTEAQAAVERQEQTAQQQAERKAAFSKRIDEQEQNDRSISAAATPEEELERTSMSFEAWDTLLTEMYEHLATVLNADQYAAEEASYQSWIEERDRGAANAAEQSASNSADEGEGDAEGDAPAANADSTTSQLAAASFKQSYTKARCYKLLDLM